ncbi:class I SAM-dependent methyltransferase [Pendulispora albinea]|uniref:Class I SAM-dependent methyltransferase n=1 Tax=Pendulispora albinea TaxID=2741071 RepID=A0ABZ2LYE0_9BACT
MAPYIFDIGWSTGGEPHMVETAVLRTTFSSDVDSYDRLRPDYPPALVDWCLPRERPCAIVEIGCGSGQATKLFVESAARIVAIDLSAEMIEKAKYNLRAPNVAFIVGAFEDIELPAGPFDAVLSAQAIHWLDFDKAFARIRKLLRSGGRFASCWNALNLERNESLRRARDEILSVVPHFDKWPDSGRARFHAFEREWCSAIEDVFGNVESTTFSRDVLRERSWFLGWISTLSWWKALGPEQKSALEKSLPGMLPEVLEVRIDTLGIRADQGA